MEHVNFCGILWYIHLYPLSDVLIHLLLSETIFSPLPLRTAEISSVWGEVWIFSGTTHLHTTICNVQFVFWRIKMSASTIIHCHFVKKKFQM